MANGIVIRELNAQDLGGLTKIHLAAFPDSALTKLGKEAVRRYYKWLLEGPHQAIRLGALVNAELAGFCFGGIFHGAMSGFLRNNRLYLSLCVLRRPWIATNPIFRDRIANALIILRKNKHNPHPQPELNKPTTRPFGILAIAVDPRQQGLGLGKLLMEEAEQVARQQGFREMNLTVSTANHRAIRFYESLDWGKVIKNSAWEGGMKKTLQIQAGASEYTANQSLYSS